VISHLQEHGFHVGKPNRFVARSLVFSEDVKLSQCNLIPLEPIFFSEERLHVLDKGASYFGREIERLADHHQASGWQRRLRLCPSRIHAVFHTIAVASHQQSCEGQDHQYAHGMLDLLEVNVSAALT
jgi:hypothetical protein